MHGRDHRPPEAVQHEHRVLVGPADQLHLGGVDEVRAGRIERGEDREGVPLAIGSLVGAIDVARHVGADVVEGRLDVRDPQDPDRQRDGEDGEGRERGRRGAAEARPEGGAKARDEGRPRRRGRIVGGHEGQGGHGSRKDASRRRSARPKSKLFQRRFGRSSAARLKFSTPVRMSRAGLALATVLIQCTSRRPSRGGKQ